MSGGVQTGMLAAAVLAAVGFIGLAGRIAGLLPAVTAELLDAPAIRFVRTLGLSVSLAAGFAALAPRCARAGRPRRRSAERRRLSRRHHPAVGILCRPAPQQCRARPAEHRPAAPPRARAGTPRRVLLWRLHPPLGSGDAHRHPLRPPAHGSLRSLSAPAPADARVAGARARRRRLAHALPAPARCALLPPRPGDPPPRLRALRHRRGLRAGGSLRPLCRRPRRRPPHRRGDRGGHECRRGAVPDGGDHGGARSLRARPPARHRRSCRAIRPPPRQCRCDARQGGDGARCADGPLAAGLLRRSCSDPSRARRARGRYGHGLPRARMRVGGGEGQRASRVHALAGRDQRLAALEAGGGTPRSRATPRLRRSRRPRR